MPMIEMESNVCPENLHFDLAISAVGYEKRCRWIPENYKIEAERKLGIEFGFLKEASYTDNRTFFENSGWNILTAKDQDAYSFIGSANETISGKLSTFRVFVDISSMSREMMANIALAVECLRANSAVEVVIAYTPAKFSGKYPPAPIRLAAPVTPKLAGWSSRPDKPLGVIMGLGCEPGLALGALQVLEPNKAWIYSPVGFDARFEETVRKANEHVSDIFDVTHFNYRIDDPVITRGRIEALINSIESSFRLICIPFGPKIFAWLSLATVVFGSRNNIGVWTFSSKEHATAVDRDASGEVIWHTIVLAQDNSA